MNNPLIVFEDSAFRIEHHPVISGYLIVRSIAMHRSLSDFSPEELGKLGPLLARGMSLIQDVAKPERIYILRFGEEVEAMHFHLFPRTTQMLELYKAHHPHITQASGAQMFDWLRHPEVMKQLRFEISPEESFRRIKTSFL